MQPKKVLITGVSGQLGFELAKVFDQNKVVLSSLEVAPPKEFANFSYQQMDFSKPTEIRSILSKVKPDLIVNPAAYTQVDKAETERELAETINVTAVKSIATYCAEESTPLIHYSTDYVFNGSGSEPWLESDQTEPQNVYGKTKLDGEEAIRNSGAPHLILRTAWVYSYRAKNFLLTILKLAEEREELKIVDDQWGTPTSAQFLAQATKEIVDQWRPGVSETLHLVPKGFANWFEFARFIIDAAKKLGIPIKTKQITPVSSDQYPAAAKRPKNSRLSTEKIAATFSYKDSTWQTELTETIDKLNAKRMQ